MVVPSLVRRFVLLFAAVALSSCALTPTEVSADRASRIKTVGIVSAMGPVKLEFAGATMSGNRAAAVDLDPALDSFVVEQVTELLKTRYDVRPVTYDSATMVAPRPEWIGNGLYRVKPPDLTPLIPIGLDAYVVIVPSISGEPGAPLNLFRNGVVVSGLGLTQFQGVLNPNTFGVHAVYAVFVVDGHDFSKIATRLPDIKPMWLSVDKSWWTDTAMSDQQKRQLQEAIRDLLAQNLPTTIRQMKLVP